MEGLISLAPRIRISIRNKLGIQTRQWKKITKILTADLHKVIPDNGKSLTLDFRADPVYYLYKKLGQTLEIFICWIGIQDPLKNGFGFRIHIK